MLSTFWWPSARTGVPKLMAATTAANMTRRVRLKVVMMSSHLTKGGCPAHERKEA